MDLPRITHRQYAVLGAIGGESISGRELRKQLKRAGIRHSRGAFYQLMARLEDGGFVEPSEEDVLIGDQRYKERWYRLSGDGANAMREVEMYYARGGQEYA